MAHNSTLRDHRGWNHNRVLGGRRQNKHWSLDNRVPGRADSESNLVDCSPKGALTVLQAVQFFGVRGYGEVEFVLSIIKVAACTGFIILGIIINCGGVPTDDRGYIGGEYWRNPVCPSPTAEFFSH